MPVMSKPSPAARTALVYITVGTLAVIWTIIWHFYLRNYPPETDVPYYFCYGFLVSGIALVVIGLAVGQIGRSARHAELPPPEVTPTEAQIDQTAAARAPMVAPVNPAAPVVNPQGQTAVPVAPVAPAAPVAGARATPAVAGREVAAQRT
jgi:hypothetical protein